MANIHKILSVEIRRLAKKEAKTAIEPLKAQILHLRKIVASQKSQIESLSKGTPAAADTAADAQAAPAEEKSEKKYRFSGERIKKIRKKIGVSQTVFAKLLGVSLKTVVNWESGMVKPREYMKSKLVGLTKLGKKELAAQIAQIKKKSKASKAAAEESAE